MPTSKDPQDETRPPLSREAVLEAALWLASSEGLDGLSMRKLGRVLGVEAMSLYHHVGGKEDVLDGLADRIASRIALPVPGQPWREGMRRRAHSARLVLGEHPWALSLLESRKHPGPASLRYYDAVLGCLRAGGFDVALAAHAFSLLDSYVYGFCLQESKLPLGEGGDLDEAARALGERMPEGELPHLAAMVEHTLRPGYDFGAEFEYGLELILDGLERRLDSGA